MIASESRPFGEGPVRHLDRVLAFRLDRASVAGRAAAAFLIAWPPLLVLAVWQALASGQDLHESLLVDVRAFARYAIAVPLLVIAESIYVPRLCHIHREFAEGGFVAADDRERFAALALGTERVLASLWMELILVAVVYAVTFSARDVQDMAAHSSWGAPLIDGERHRSWAGWWRVLVSHPLFLVLGLRSVVRLAAWTRMVWGISRLKLRLIPAHADLVGGLRFVTTSVYAFLPLAFIFGVLMAARAAEGVLIEGLPPSAFRGQIIATPVIAAVVFAGPLMLFRKQLWDLKVNGLFDYGVLATRVGRRFEARWLPTGSEMTEAVLEAPDFSATTDLFSIVANVRESRLFLVDSTVIVPLVAAVMAPFLPLLFALVPFEDILAFIEKAVL